MRRSYPRLRCAIAVAAGALAACATGGSAGAPKVDAQAAGAPHVTAPAPAAAAIRIEAVSPFASPHAIELTRRDGSELRIEAGSATRSENGALVYEGVRIAANEGVAVVTREHTREADLRTRLEEKLPYLRSHRVTLYDARGDVLFEKAGVEYTCVSLSRGAEAIACLIATFEYWPEPPSPEDVKPDVTTIVVLGRDGAERARFREPPGSVPDFGIRISPNGRWLAYERRGRHHRVDHVVLRDLEGGASIEIPAREDERLRHFVAVDDAGDLLRIQAGGGGAGRTASGDWPLEVVWRRPR